MVESLASLIVSCIQGKLVAIIAPTEEKAKLTMRYYIEHLGDSPLFYSQLEKNTRLERLRQEESKKRIILRNGGGIYALSVNQRNLSRSIEQAMGEGAEIVIPDEAGLIHDDTEATIFRMITGKKSNDKLYCKIGNPFYSQIPITHFKNDWENPLYHKIYIPADVGLTEGRIDKEELAIAKTKPLYGVLYDCEFPPEDTMDKDGYYLLVKSDEIRMAEDCRKHIKIADYKSLKVGADIAGGGDDNVFKLRQGKFAITIGRNKSNNTMDQVREIERIHDEYKVPYENFNIDMIGIGRGVVDRCHELKYNVNGVTVGESARDQDSFANLRAELYWETRNWIKSGGLFDYDERWQQLTWIKWKNQSGEKKVLIEPKERLKKRTHKSPDDADALALTFYEPDFVGFI